MELTFHSGNEQVLWSNHLSSVFLVFGEEDLLKHEVERALIQRFTDQAFHDFDVEILNADAVTSDAIIGAASQAPFGSLRRVVVVRGMEQWRDRAHFVEVERLAAGILRLGSTACLILIVAAEDDEARRKTAISSKLDSAVKQCGVLVACRGLRDNPLHEWIRERCQKEGKRISQDTCELLVASVGTEMRGLELELYKLIHFAGERPIIDQSDVSAVVAVQAEDVMFQCVDAVVRRQTDRALTLLSELHRHDPKPQAVAGRLLALLVRQYRLMWQAKHLAATGISARDIRFLSDSVQVDLPSENAITQVAFKASDLFSIVGRYSDNNLRRAFYWLVLVDLANKGGVTEEETQFSTDPIANLKMLVLDLTGNH